MTKKSKPKRPSRNTQKMRSGQPLTDPEAAGPTGNDPWQTFLQAHPQRAAQYGDEIYAIPDGLIDAIKADVPELLSLEDERFERDLTHLSGLGFSLGQPIVFPALEHVQQPAGRRRVRRDLLAERHETNAAALRELIDEEKRLDGRNQYEIELRNAEALKRETTIGERQLGYVGWLVTNPDFRSHRDAFHEKWEQRIRRERRLPSLPVSYFGERPRIKKQDRDFYVDYSLFYQFWGLDTLAGWELPYPMRPGIGTPSLYSTIAMEDAGLVLFLPWHLLGHKDVKLADLADHHGAPPHLKDWIDGGKEFGTERFATMLELYCYLELALKRRYRQRLGRKAEALDRAVSRYFLSRSGSKVLTPERKAESIKKTRSEMSRRLSTY